MFDPDAHMQRINCGMVYLCACLVAGIRLTREWQMNVRMVPTGKAIENRLTSATRFSTGCFGGCRSGCPTTVLEFSSLGASISEPK